jgi:hypothetical protein
LKLVDLVDNVTIDPRKLTHYALEPNSPKGKHKAVLFEKLLGFTKENYTDLLHQLETKSLQAKATFHSEDQYGKRYTVDVLVDGIKGQQVIVKTGWLVQNKARKAHLVTLYVKKR